MSHIDSDILKLDWVTFGEQLNDRYNYILQKGKSLSFQLNESIPDNGGIFKYLDPTQETLDTPNLSLDLPNTLNGRVFLLFLPLLFVIVSAIQLHVRLFPSLHPYIRTDQLHNDIIIALVVKSSSEKLSEVFGKFKKCSSVTLPVSDAY